MTRDDAIVHLEHIGKSFAKPDGGTLQVLDDINLDIRSAKLSRCSVVPDAANRRCCGSSRD